MDMEFEFEEEPHARVDKERVSISVVQVNFPSVIPNIYDRSFSTVRW